ncbi:hypothetical protein [Jonesia quinghaiensis]|uniref:hypothetical protein n=1 Tax=Jonesia quinghaiensis TaxID=262806 RepID=UPI00048A91D9|nr:hypothetical protein [Jonesia quinghaiensis]
MKKLCIVLAFGLVAGTGGCSTVGQASCLDGTESPEGALSVFVDAVSENDAEEAQKYLQVGNTVDEAEFDALRNSFENADGGNLNVTEVDQAGTQYIFQITTGDDAELLKEINVTANEDNGSCYSVVWGNFPQTPDDPESSPATP